MEYVCLLEYMTHTRTKYTATGFLFGFIKKKDTIFAAIVTNYHVVSDWSSGKAYFDYHDGNEGNKDGIHLAIDNLLWNKELDCAMFYIDNADLKQRFGSNKRKRLVDLVAGIYPNDKSLTLIGHPSGERMQADVFMEIQRDADFDKNSKTKSAKQKHGQGENAGVNVHFFDHDYRVFYLCTSFHGSSGAPCFRIGNGQFDLVALQQGGIYLGKTDADIKNAVSDYESGILMDRIKKNMTEQMASQGMSWY